MTKPVQPTTPQAPQAPKKPRSAIHIFVQEKRSEIKGGTLKLSLLYPSLGKTSKKIAKMWLEMEEEERKVILFHWK